MEAKLSERKRKEPPNPLLGMFTRSKSQIYSHLNRSGRILSDASVLKPSHPHRQRQCAEMDLSHRPRRRLKSSIPTAGKDEGEVTLSPICAKDLRSRRVFSKPPVVLEQEEKNTVLSGSVERLDYEVNPNLKFAEIDSLEKKPLSNGDGFNCFDEELSPSVPANEGEKVDVGIGCIGGVSSENPILSRSTGVCSAEKDNEIKAFGQVGRKTGFLEVDSAFNDKHLGDFSPTLSNCDQIIDEENVRTTPPDPDIFNIQKNGESRSNEGHNVLQPEDNCTGMPQADSPYTQIDSVPRRKLVLNPCARLKVFKSPSSVSYRRLLPYLLDIAKDKSRAIEINSCPKIETVLEEKPTVQYQVPLADDTHFITSGFKDKTLKPMLYTEDVSTQRFPSNMQAQAGDSTNEISSNPTSIDCSSDTIWPKAITANGQNEITSPSNSPQGDSSHVYKAPPAKRLKVFKTPSSVSYRRLLPYLLDISKDKSCALKIKSCPKVEIVLEGNPSAQSQVPLAHASIINSSDLEDRMLKSVVHTASQEMTKDGFEEKLPSDMQAGDSINKMPSNSKTADCSSDNTWPTAVTTGSQNGMPSPSNSPLGDLSPVDQFSSAKSGEINISPALVSDPTVSLTDSTSKVLPGYSDGDDPTNMMTCEGTITVYQSTSPLNALPSLEPPNVSPAKGILKRNPRGCRGLCTCLNCASFRVHAENAFEFSRNQLQDTEEIVLELMKELSQLRTALEMSFDVSNSQAISKADQIKEVCASASKAEGFARTRLKEMNEDLFVHCRVKCLQRPRVNFAIKIEDKGFEERSKSSKET